MADNTERDLVPLNEERFRKPAGIRSYVEILLFVLFFAKTLADAVIVNLLEKSTCLVVLDYNLTNCTEPVSPTTQGQLQQTTANLTLARTLIEGFIPSFLVLFIGPWSDTNGRRPVILSSLLGYTISLAMWTILAFIPGLYPSYFLLASLPVALSAGSPAFFLAIICYISDITRYNKRALRMGVLMGCVMAGILAASLLAPVLLASSADRGYPLVFATSTATLVTCLIYTYLCLPESVNVVESERSNLFRIDHVKEIIRTFFKPREGYTRGIVMLIVFNIVIYVVTLEGELAQLYMFTQRVYQWDLSTYSQFVAAGIIFSVQSSFLYTWLLSKVLKVSDMPVIFGVAIFGLLKAVVESMATSSKLLYVASFYGSMYLLISPFSRSLLSKLIPPEDLGKIFAFTSFLENTTPLYASPFYTLIYKATMESQPFAIFWLSTGLESVAVLTAGVALVLYCRQPHPTFTRLEDDVDSNPDPESTSIQA